MDRRIFYVEDDQVLAYLTKDQLESKGYEVMHFPDGESAMTAIANEPMDIAILDIMLPGIDGFQIAEKLRSIDDAIPILFLSAKTMKEDRLKGFKLGADDYITKPFSMEELIYKIEVFLKRRHIDTRVERKEWMFGNSVFNAQDQALECNGQSSSLTYREAEIMKMFVSKLNQIVKREHILEQIWGKNDYFHGRSLDVFVSRIRKYLKADERLELRNVHGVGFILLEKE